MKFTEVGLPGAYIVEAEANLDERGSFARLWCRDEFADRGLSPLIAQCSISSNFKRGTLRGLHYQASPHQEAKLVRCTRGGVYDVIIDLRPRSPARGTWVAVELTATNGKMLYVPEGFAHGFQTLEDDTEVFYQISTPYVSSAARGIRWDDPSYNIAWPQAPTCISKRDGGYPNFIG